MTCDKWRVAHGGGWTFFQDFSSPALTVCDWQCLEDSELMDDSMSNGVDCRTASATPGLLNSSFTSLEKYKFKVWLGV